MNNRNIYHLSCIIVFTLFLLQACYKETVIDVVPDFEVQVAGNDYSVPATIQISNTSTGANRYRWTFEGGVPETSDKKEPGKIKYSQAGTYIIRLEASNDNHQAVKEFTIHLDSTLVAGFDVEILVNDYIPAEVKIKNNTIGAKSQEWTFDGANVTSSTEFEPGNVIYNTPGKHTIVLKTSNGQDTSVVSRSFTLKPGLKTGFSYTPSFSCEDGQAPFTALLQNTSESATHYRWSATGGTIKNDTARHTEIYFSEPGNYTVSLYATNGKQEQTYNQQIHVLPNTNLYTMMDVKLGINTALQNGCFYSCTLRNAFREDEITKENAGKIDFAFFGLSSNFNYLRFLSPDSVQEFVFEPIPGAKHTAIVNTIETTPLQFSGADFDKMADDVPLRPLNIRENDTGIRYFNSQLIPRIVLFQTSDNRKGAVKIKKIVPQEKESYIIVDIKVQKEYRK